MLNLRLFKLRYRRWWFGKPLSPPYAHVVQIGDPILRQKAAPVDLKEVQTPFMIEVYKNLENVIKRSGAVGLAAPQLGVSLRVMAFHFPSPSVIGSPLLYKHREMEPVAFQIWVNPEIKITDFTKVSFEEGCESVKGFMASVPRYKQILLTGWNERGEERTPLSASGWTARLIQHEVEHLDGCLFVDSMDTKSLSFAHWDEVNRKGGRIFTTFIPGQ